MRMRLSQSQLSLLELCPRKFQHVYLEHLGLPVSPEQRSRLQWGHRFHLLMQQQELLLPPLPAESSVPEADELRRCVEQFWQTVPQLSDSQSAVFRQSEHRRTLEFQDYLLTVVYDLLVLDDRQAQILDWKTYPRPPHPQHLMQSWQTRLYLFVLTETSDYRPDQVAMTYWFVQTGDRSNTPQSHTLSYTAALHQQTQEILSRQLQQLTGWLNDYPDVAFPQVAEAAQHCNPCPFDVRCQRRLDDRTRLQQLPDLAAIQEILL